MNPTQPPSSRLRIDEEPRRRSSTLPQAIANSSTEDIAVDFSSTFAGGYTESDDDGHEYMEQVVHLAGSLRTALAPNAKEDSSSVINVLEETLKDRPELKELLEQSKPHPERREQYAQVFAQRK